MSTPSGNPHPSENNPQQPASGPAGQQGPSPYGYQAAQPSGYAYPSAASLPQAERPPLPKEVNIAFWLIIAAGALSFISSLIAPDASGMTGSFAAMSMGIVIAVSLVFTAIYVLLAVFIRKGHNWARITATVLAALSLIGLVLGWASNAMLQSNPELMAELEAQGQQIQQSGLSSTLGIIVTLLGIVAVVLLYRKPSNHYFKPQQPTY